MKSQKFVSPKKTPGKKAQNLDTDSEKTARPAKYNATSAIQIIPSPTKRALNRVGEVPANNDAKSGYTFSGPLEPASAARKNTGSNTNARAAATN
ncbi:MAG: hypothetical protein NTZ94_01870 [Verrucomicrobia bacterium]|nr:hypothetical protein [Verrucomicrobiota bacterium]